MVTITRYGVINIFQTEHFSAVKFAMGYEKNMLLLVIAKNLRKIQKIGLGSLNLCLPEPFFFFFFFVTRLPKGVVTTPL